MAPTLTKTDLQDTHQPMITETEPSTPAGRPGVTRDDVAAAIATLESQHRKPSLRLIRETLGRGSPNTISRHRQSLMAERIRDSGEIPAGTTEADVHGIVIELLDRVWGEAGEAADAIVRQKTKESERAVNQARALKSDAQDKVIALEASLQAMTAQVADLIKTREALQQTVKEARATATAAQSEHTDVVRSLNGAEITLEHQRQTLAERQQRIDNLTTELIDARNQHRDAQASTEKKGQAQAEKIEALQKSVYEGRAVIAERDATIVQLNQRIADAAANLQSAHARADAALTQVDEVQQENSQVMQQLGSAQAALTAEKRNHQFSNAAFEDRLAEKERLIVDQRERLDAVKEKGG